MTTNGLAFTSARSADLVSCAGRVETVEKERERRGQGKRGSDFYFSTIFVSRSTSLLTPRLCRTRAAKRESRVLTVATSRPNAAATSLTLNPHRRTKT